MTLVVAFVCGFCVGFVARRLGWQWRSDQHAYVPLSAERRTMLVDLARRQSGQ